MRDQMNYIHPLRSIAPVAAVADNTAYVSEIVDVKGFDALTFVIVTGSLADADATFTVLIEDGDAADLSDNVAVADAHLVGTEALAGFTFAADNKTRKIGYIGKKRYVRMTITPANNSGNVFLAAIAILGLPAIWPTANPPG